MIKKTYDELLVGTKAAKVLRGEPIQERKPQTHHEADLHLRFCKWVKQTYPDLQFVRHEKEAKRSRYMQNLVKVYNTELSNLPDFELLDGKGFYIEFKRPGRNWQHAGTINRDCIDQYLTHRHLWAIGRCAYFCNDLEQAKQLLVAYLRGIPEPQQVYNLPEGEDNEAWFADRGL